MMACIELCCLSFVALSCSNGPWQWPRPDPTDTMAMMMTTVKIWSDLAGRGSDSIGQSCGASWRCVAEEMKST